MKCKRTFVSLLALTLVLALSAGPGLAQGHAGAGAQGAQPAGPATNGVGDTDATTDGAHGAHLLVGDTTGDVS